MKRGWSCAELGLCSRVKYERTHMLHSLHRVHSPPTRLIPRAAVRCEAVQGKASLQSSLTYVVVSVSLLGVAGVPSQKLIPLHPQASGCHAGACRRHVHVHCTSTHHTWPTHCNRSTEATEATEASSVHSLHVHLLNSSAPLYYVGSPVAR